MAGSNAGANSRKLDTAEMMTLVFA
jgi:hypothetical protein